MVMLIAAAAAFVLLHLLVSGTRVRDALTGTIGQGPYMGLFSLASIGLLTWMLFAFGAAHASAMNAAYWGATPVTKYVQLVLMLIAFLLVVPGLLTPNPTSVRQEATLDRPDAIKGMLRITRHPFLWGVAIWAAGHLLVNGDRAGLVLFGSMLALALLGTTSIDAKRKRTLGAKWDAFAAQTSNVPFAAIAAGRQSLNIGEIGWWRLALAVILWAVMLFVHPMAFHVSPMP
ncbi:MAG TPA: NnrU family protein [Caulobacteraceae bacterium]|nr:NnrU family protein [Caulobacteraceae bacterium]